MANPDSAASPDTFENKVTAALKASARNEEGKLEFPENTPEEVVFAATSEQRRRDTQAEFTRSKQTQAALEAEKAELLKQVSSDVKLELSPEAVDELDNLKFSDPEAWRHKMNTYETEARTKRTNEINERLQTVSADGTKTAELERRVQVLQEFSVANPGLVIDDDVIANDLPPRITNKLQNNEVTFEDFLREASEYLKAGKVVGSPEKTLNQPNLSKAGGGSNPSDDAVKFQNYSDLTF
jgi:hypothetical protein